MTLVNVQLFSTSFERVYVEWNVSALLTNDSLPLVLIFVFLSAFLEWMMLLPFSSLRLSHPIWWFFFISSFTLPKLHPNLVIKSSPRYLLLDIIASAFFHGKPRRHQLSPWTWLWHQRSSPQTVLNKPLTTTMNCPRLVLHFHASLKNNNITW